MNGKQRNSQRMQIEHFLIFQLNYIIEQIKQFPDINDISQAQSAFSQRLESSLRKGAIEAYDLGAEYIEQNKKVYGITASEVLEESDIANNLVIDYSNKYWRNVDKLLHRNDVLLQKYDYEPRSPLNSNYMATSTAIGIVTKALALGSRNKIRQLHDTGIIRSAMVSPRDSQTGLGDGERDETKDQVEWDATMDQNTCEVCADLNGQFFDFEEDFPMPAEACEGGDNCRCTLDIEEASSVIVYSDEEDEKDY